MKSKRKLALAAAVVLTLAVLAVLFLHTTLVRNYALNKARAYLLANEGIDFSASDLEFSLRRFSVDLRGVQLKSAAAPELPPFLVVGSASVRVLPSGLLHGALSLGDARLDDVSLQFVISPDGISNLPETRGASSPQSGLPAFDLLPRSLQITGGSVSFDNQEARFRAVLPQWQLELLRATSEPAYDMHWHAGQSGSVAWNGRTAPLDRLDLEALLHKSALDVKQLRIESSRSGATADGVLQDFGQPDLRMRAALDLDLAALLSFAGVSEPIGGAIHAETTVTGPLTRAMFTARLSGSNLNYDDYRQIEANASINGAVGSDLLRIDALTARSPTGTASLNGILALNAVSGRTRLSGTVDDLDLQTLMRRFRLPFELASSASASFDASWPGLNLDDARLHTAIGLKATRSAPGHNLLPMSGSLTADLSGETVRASISFLESLNGRWRGAVTLTSWRDLSGELVGTLKDVAQSIDNITRFAGSTPPPAAVTPRGTLNLTARLSGTIDRPAFSADLNAPALEFGPLRNIGLASAVQFNPDAIEVERADLTWQRQKFAAHGLIGLKETSPSLNLTASTRGASLAAMITGLGENKPIEGAADVDVSVQGTFAKVRARADATISDLRAYGENLGHVSLRAGLNGEQLDLIDLRLEKPGAVRPPGRLAAQGTLDLATEKFSFRASGNGLEIGSLLLPGNIPLRASLNLSAEGGGVISKPVINTVLDAASVQIGRFDLGSVKLRAREENGLIGVEAGVPRFNVSAHASLRPVAPYPTTFEATADNTDLVLLMPALTKGTVSASVRGSGALDTWERGEVEASVSSLALDYHGLSVRNPAPLRFGYKNGMLQFTDLGLAAGASTLNLSGSLPVKASAGTGALDLKADIDSGTLLSLVRGQPPAAASGKLVLDAVVRGSLQHLDPVGRLTMTDGVLTARELKPPLTGVTLLARLENGAIAIDKAEAQLGAGRLAATGVIPLGLLPLKLPVGIELQQGAARLSVKVQDLQLADLAELPPNVNGTVSLRLEGALPRLGDWKSLDASAIFDQLRLQVAQVLIEQSAPTTIEARDGVVQIRQFLLTGPQTRIQIGGSADLTGGRRLGVRIDGDFDASLLALFTGDLRLHGPAQFQVTCGGTLTSPSYSGVVELNRGTITYPSPRLLAQNLNVRLDLAPGRVTIREFSGELNGGPLTATGYVGYRGQSLLDFHIDAATTGAYFNFYGLEAQAKADLQMRSQKDLVAVSGSIHILEGFYRQDVTIGGALFRFIQGGGGGAPLLEQKPSPFLDRLRLDIAVDTSEPIIVNNNLASVALDCSLKFGGAWYQPGVTGRITMEPGGSVTFQERTYYIDSGAITFANQTRIEPDFNIAAETDASGYDINLKLNGTPEKFSATFSSPTRSDLTQPDIISILMTGKPLDQTHGQGLNIARNQALSYLSGSLGGYVSRTAQTSLGITEISFDPSFITSETNNPGVRLTIGEAVARFLRLIYSISLTNSNDQIYAVEYDVTQRFFARAIRQSDNTYRFDFQHNLPFGGGPALGSPVPVQRAKQRIGKVEFEGETVFPSSVLTGKLRVKSGKPYDFFKVQKGIDKLQNYYHEKGRVEARITVGHATRDNIVDLTFRVDPGPDVTFIFNGASVSGDIRNAVRTIWSQGILDTQRGEDAAGEIRSRLVAAGYLTVGVTYDVQTPSPGRERVTFDVKPGVNYRNVAVDFPGASPELAARLQSALASGDLGTGIYTNPADAGKLLTLYCQQQGYLTAKVQEPRAELDPAARTGKVVIRVEAGPLFKIDRVEFQGNRAFPESRLDAVTRLAPGTPYRPDLAQTAGYRLQQFYWQNGYNDLTLSNDLKLAPAAGSVDLIYHITENKRQVVESVEISGNRETSRNFIQNQLTLAPGQVFDSEKANLTRRKLYDTGAYSLVTVDAAPAPTGVKTPDDEKPMVVRVKLREPKPFSIRYGGYYDTGRGPGFIADLVSTNFIGAGRTFGARTQYDSELHEVRTYFSQPTFWGHRIASEAVAYAQRDLSVANFTTDRLGLSLQQEVQLPAKMILSYGYRYENDHTYGTTDPTLPSSSFRISPLSLTVSRDNRDSLLDATHGTSFSHALEYSPSQLGADFQYLKYFGQHFWFEPLTAPAPVPLSRGKRLPRWVYAGDIRAGFIWSPSGQIIPMSERFFAGGGTTLRGFSENSVGPFDTTLQQPAGGASVFITNHELRFPLFSMLGGAAFLDIGNVYARARDFNPFSVRKDAGLGLRLRTPWVLLRADYGFKLDRRPGESLGTFFLSIGQAF